MATNLVIVESPTKAKTIKKILGRNYKVMASVGHIRDLPKSTLGVDEENNFEPKYINIRGKGPLINELKKEAKASKNVYLATDPDREGEAIAWHLAHILDIDEDETVRVTFNEITKSAVTSEMKKPRKIDMDLVDAQQGRRIIDRLVGYKISPLLWKKIKSGLSAGRVQSVALKIICDREQEIRDFKPEEYWTLEADLSKVGKRTKFTSKYYGTVKGGKDIKFEPKNRKDVDEILNRIDRDNFVVAEKKEGTAKRAPYKPFTTSTLQQQASSRLNFKTSKTMMVAQKLYEGIEIKGKGSVGLITYMRTDSTRISDEAKFKCLNFIEEEYGKEYMGYARKGKAQKGMQDAHECIRPTDPFLTPESIKDYLSRDEYRLYNLIWQRFVASLMKDASYKTVALKIMSGTEIFKTTGRTLTFDGFLKVYTQVSEKDELLPDLEENEKLKLWDLKEEQKFTQPPARYTEAALIKFLEENGIGRPSTYAPTISTIQSRYYVVVEDKKFVPTELGEAVNEFLTKYFTEIINIDFSAQLETDLDQIAEGERDWRGLVGEVNTHLGKCLEVATEEAEKIKVRDKVSDVICEKCGRNMVIKIGRFGKFLACPGFPECRNAKPLVEKIGVKCPNCEDGEIVKRRSKKGRVFYGCSNYPKCEFVSWDKPIDKMCPKCGSILTEVRTRKGITDRCSNKNCGYSEGKDGK